MSLDLLYKDIENDASNELFRSAGYKPLYTASKLSKIVIVGQAPGRKAQESGIPWNDSSGDTLRSWLGINKEQFYNPDIIALIPMDFYYPGKGKHGDLPPRKDFAPRWHPLILNELRNVQLIVLIGNYAQKYYLNKASGLNLTETVRAYKDYSPEYFPIVHPSPLNFRWRTKNPWFEKSVIPDLQARIKEIIGG
jgi:uracil-DNA glycosylase